MTPETEFKKQLRALLNLHSRENQSNTPDWILANFLEQSLEAFDRAVANREVFYGREPGEALSTEVGRTPK